MSNFLVISILTVYLAISKVQAVPVEAKENITKTVEFTNETLVESRNNNDKEILSEKIDLDTSASEAKAAAVDYDEHLDALAEGGGGNPPGDGSLLDAFHQYVNRYGAGAYSPYPAVGAYPAPIAYNNVPVPVPVPAVYPAPYAVQTAYEGYLVPATTASTTTSTTAATTTTTASPLSNVISLLNPFNFFTNILPAIMMSTLFRILAGFFSIVGMVFFSGAFGDLICRFTPICDIGFNTASYFMRLGRSKDVGRMISEELTPERLIQAEDFVRKAIRTYRDLQKTIKTE